MGQNYFRPVNEDLRLYNFVNSKQNNSYYIKKE